MSGTEFFDIFNESNIKIGVDSRENAHAKGLWHHSFHCWVIQRSAGEDQLLLQLRHPNKDTFPGLLDISCAGHLQAGETVEDGVRELEEELGVQAEFDELIYCGIVAQENVISADLIDREFNHVFLYESSRSVEEYEFQKEEITGLFFVKVEDFRKLVFGETKECWVEGVVTDQGQEGLSQERRKIGLHHFTPNSEEYYKLLFNNIAALLFPGQSQG